jgi:shikimate kinase
MKRLAVFVLKGGLKHLQRFREGYDLAYLLLESGKLIPPPKSRDYDEVVLVDSTAASGLTLLRHKRLLEEMGFKNIKLAAHPLTKHAEALLDIRLPRQEPSGAAVFVCGLPGSGKSALARGLAEAIGAAYVKWGIEVQKRFDVGLYGEKLWMIETENPFAVAERLVLDGVFDSVGPVVVVDGVKSIWQMIYVSYATLRAAVPLYVSAPPEARRLVVSVRGMSDDAYDEERTALFAQPLREVELSSVVVRMDSKVLEEPAASVFKALGVSPLIRGYFNPFITKRALLESWFDAWTRAKRIDSPLVDVWISQLDIQIHRGYVERLKRRGAEVGEVAAEVISLFATAVRIVDDILDEHTVRLYSEEGVTAEAWWVRRGIYLAVVDSVALMVEARKVARRLGVEQELINAAARMVEAVKVELELEKTGKPPTLSDWLKAAEREAAFREFAYGLAGLDREASYVEGLAAQIKDDLWGATKGRREDTEARLNRPLIQRVCARPEDALEALKTAKTRREAAEILAAYCSA